MSLFRKQDRGAVLLTLPMTTRRILIAIAGIAAVCLVVTVHAVSGKRDFSTLALWAVLLGPYLLRPKVRFREQGIEFPPAERNRPQFLRWDQFERWYWDEGKLQLVGVSRVLAGGPVPSQTVEVPPAKQSEVTAILSLKMPEATTS